MIPLDPDMIFWWLSFVVIGLLFLTALEYARRRGWIR